MKYGQDNYCNYRSISARFGSIGTCGHPINKGDSIGYNPKTKHTQCTSCWDKWISENREADYLETHSSACPW